MKWKLKAVIQKALSSIPGGEKINFLLTKFAGQLPASDDLIKEKVRIAKLHIDAVSSVIRKDHINNANFFEFGAGWELIIPIAFFALGVRRQTIIDIDPLLRLGLVNNTLTRLPTYIQTSNTIYRISTVSDLEKLYGIRYSAPTSVTSTGLADNTFDAITNTDTLEHVRASELDDILRECFRILRPGGIMSSMIDMRDHYSYFDSSINPYNFLRYSSKHWSIYNSSIHFQNRLRAIDFTKAFVQAGFILKSTTSPEVTTDHIRMLRSIPVVREYSEKYAEEQLSIQGIHIVAIKPE